MNDARLGLRTEPNMEMDRLTALEARIVVLEIVSISALAMAMDTSDNADTEAARGMASLILATIDQRCDELKVCDYTRDAARDYARNLLGVAMDSLYSRPN